jgi:hypothetical protein
MYQQEIKFFWPLTEQIALDLDYTNAGKPDCGIGSTSFIVGNGGTAPWTTSSYITTSQLTVTTEGIETPAITFTLNKKPFIIKRLAYKFLGINWKVK